MLEPLGRAIFEKTKFKLDIEKTFNVFFFVTINIVLVTIIGFLTIDSDANFNSRFGGFLLSFLKVEYWNLVFNIKRLQS